MSEDVLLYIYFGGVLVQQQEIVESIKTKVNFGKNNHKLIEFKMLREIRWKLKKKKENNKEN